MVESAAGDLARSAPIVFFHAHPDDEAIFTGGTIRLLADAGHDVIVVIATSGERGVADERTADALGATRQIESRTAADILGAHDVVFLGYGDSGVGIGPDGPHPHPASFAAADPEHAGTALARIVTEVGAEALVIYDPGGIYDHPDHVQAHRAGRAAHRRSGVRTCYEVTVDYEYLHFVETHLVEAAAESLPERADRRVGLPSVLIDVTVDVRTVLPQKRSAMLAHISQIPDGTFPEAHNDTEFAAVYGYEWFVRHGEPGPIEQLPQPGGHQDGRTGSSG